MKKPHSPQTPQYEDFVLISTFPKQEGGGGVRGGLHSFFMHRALVIIIIANFLETPSSRLGVRPAESLCGLQHRPLCFVVAGLGTGFREQFRKSFSSSNTSISDGKSMLIIFSSMKPVISCCSLALYVGFARISSVC